MRSLLVLLCLVVPILAVDKVSVIVFFMSKCPDCKYWSDMFQSKIMKAAGVPEIVDFRSYYVAKNAATGFTCLHGEPECKGDIIQMCAYNLTHTATNPYVLF